MSAGLGAGISPLAYQWLQVQKKVMPGRATVIWARTAQPPRNAVSTGARPATHGAHLLKLLSVDGVPGARDALAQQRFQSTPFELQPELGIVAAEAVSPVAGRLHQSDEVLREREREGSIGLAAVLDRSMA